ncbi:AAA family ATPase [Vibrio coralliilyticus]|uniref:AAA family ATPase n=1 Tax=Vibrio coralliilyticus TaxID=190893 RepID=UPI001E367F16|nr:ATP-binding protein [Vibrio coralliilyticus]MCC2525543.1 ATP-binding protein [Vibrio coralliilyticus]
MKRRSNPFVFSQVAVNENFCGRSEELNKIIYRIETGQNSLVHGLRRFGKTSLIQSAFTAISKNGFLPVYVDLNSIMTADDFAQAFYASASAAMRSAGGFSIENTAKELRDYFRKVTFDITLSSSGEASFKPVLANSSTRSFDEYLEDTMIGLNEYSKHHDVRVVVALDEFQEIAQVTDCRIDAKLREFLQRSDNEVCFIFSGSKRHMLNELFHNDSAALYKIAVGLEIKAIDEADFFKFVADKMNAEITPEIFHLIYHDIAQGESKLIQQVCHQLYMNVMFNPEIKTIEHSHVSEAINEILDADEALYSMLEKKHSPSHRLALQHIARCGGINLFTEANLKASEMSKPTLQSALKQLIKSTEKQIQIVDIEDNRYFIPDRSFELYLRRKVLGQLV